MIAVSNTSPLNYLVLIGSVDLLPAIFARVLAPSAVMGELSHPRSPSLVREWANAPPGWLVIQDPKVDVPCGGLGRGETAAISLALELNADRILIDDRDAAREAARLSLSVVGTLGVLEAAAHRGFVEIEEKIGLLRSISFRASDSLYRALRDRVRGRK